MFLLLRLYVMDDNRDLKEINNITFNKLTASCAFNNKGHRSYRPNKFPFISLSQINLYKLLEMSYTSQIRVCLILPFFLK